MSVDASVVVALTLANEMIGATGVVARRAADVYGEGDAAGGGMARWRWEIPARAVIAGARTNVELGNEGAWAPAILFVIPQPEFCCVPCVPCVWSLT